MNFSYALIKIKEGDYLKRMCWDDKESYVFLIKPIDVGEYSYRSHIVMHEKGNFIAMWNPDISDLMANDWVLK